MEKLLFKSMQFLAALKESLKLGFTSFGGPVAHLAYFREAYVERLKWLSEEKFAELLAVCQFIPGPASSQLGAAIGYEKGGWLGALGAWIGFTLPSAVLMILFVTTMGVLSEWALSGAIHGLKIVAVAVVANAVLGMQQKLCPNLKGICIAVIAAVLMIVFRAPWIQPLLIVLGGILGALLFRRGEGQNTDPEKKKLKHPVGALIVLSCFLIGVFTLCSVNTSHNEVTMLTGLAKTGSMVFGGGHVVLPLLEAETVAKGLMTQDQFLAGYGFAQAVPGPLFTFGAYIGAFVGLNESAWLGGLIGVVMIFLPGMILLTIGLPIWNAYKHVSVIKASLKGASAAVVGLILAALVYMLQAGAISTVVEVIIAVTLAVVVHKKLVPVWAVVLSGVAIGFAL